MNTVTVIGAGAWGTALGGHLAGQGCAVRLWAYEKEVVAAIATKRENTLFLPGISLPTGLVPTQSFREALVGTEALLFAVPSHVARGVLRDMAPHMKTPVPFISASKGIEEASLKLMTQVMADELPQFCEPLLMVLSGPSFAAEVCRGQPTAVCLAGRDLARVRALQELLMSPTFRVYIDHDMIGIQLGGALKNVIALAAGVVDGLGLGHNARAALITRGLAEMVRLGAAMGADPRTFYGLSGVGDLVLTCTGPLSRNHTVGVRLGKGEPLTAILQNMQAVVEGVRTARAARGLALRYGVEMPIVQEINAVLFEGKACRQAVADLMEREAKEEKKP